MSNFRPYMEDSLGVSSCNEAAIAKSFSKMKTALQKHAKDPFRDVDTICKNPQYLGILTEAIKLNTEDPTINQYQLEDMQRVNELYNNVSMSIMNEAISTVGDLSPIMINSFGIQERSLISPHLPRAVKQVTAKVDNFKLTERIPFLVDIKGNKQKFIDAFIPTADGATANLSLKETVDFSFAVPSVNVDLYEGSDDTVAEGDAGYRVAVDKDQVFSYESAISSVTVDGADEGSVDFGIESLRNPDVENGTFRVTVTWTESDVPMSAVVLGQFDLSNGKLLSIATSDPKITEATFNMIMSPETHISALSVGYDVKHTPVNIPIGEHFEYSLSEEFKDASEKYYNEDAMALLTDYMGRAVEQVKDINTLAKYQELEKRAVFTTTFNCTPAANFSQGKEEYIRREFHPFIEKACIILKNKVRIPQCHFRVLGNPLDIRVAAAAGVEYIYKRNEQFAGEIAIDYEFSVSSDVHKIFYLSSERVPAGKLMIFLIPNTIENNISTVNHYEYATYVSNKYRGTKSNLPTVMISTRYLTKEYYPVIGIINVVNNLVDDTNVTTPTGTDLANGIYSKVDYINK